jgi:hypothetical protein
MALCLLKELHHSNMKELSVSLRAFFAILVVSVLGNAAMADNVMSCRKSGLWLQYGTAQSYYMSQDAFWEVRHYKNWVNSVLMPNNWDRITHHLYQQAGIEGSNGYTLVARPNNRPNRKFEVRFEVNKNGERAYDFYWAYTGINENENCKVRIQGPTSETFDACTCK